MVKKVKLSSILKLVLGVIITALGLYFFLKDVDLPKLSLALRSTKISTLFIVSLLAVFTLYLRAIRWKLILPDIPETTKKHLFSNVMIGYMFNNILPARMGELARAFLLWHKNHFPVTVCVGTLILERLLDLCMFFIFFIVPVFVLPQCSALHLYAYGASAIVLSVVTGLFLYAIFQATMVRTGNWFVSKTPVKIQERVKKVGRDLASNLGWLHQPRRVVLVLLLSLITTLCYPLMIILLAGSGTMSFGILEGMFAQAFAAFGAAIPGLPGYVGTLHAVMLQGLTVLGMDVDPAIALVIIYHAVNYILVTIIGLYFFFREDLSLKDITQARKVIEQEK